MIPVTSSNHILASVVASHATPIDFACARLRSAGMRITRPRISILEVLARQTSPIAIEKLHAQLDEGQCDLVTVYRCLAAFEELHLVRRSFLHSGTCLYELSLGDRPSHYHVVCRECGRIEPIDYFPVTAAETSLLERGYTQLTPLVEFFGICPPCRAASVRTELALVTTARAS